MSHNQKQSIKDVYRPTALEFKWNMIGDDLWRADLDYMQSRDKLGLTRFVFAPRYKFAIL